MIPLKPDLPMAVVEAFNALHGEAREKAIATGNYDEFVKSQQAQEPAPEPQPQRRTAFDEIDDGVAT